MKTFITILWNVDSSVICLSISLSLFSLIPVRLLHTPPSPLRTAKGPSRPRTARTPRPPLPPLDTPNHPNRRRSNLTYSAFLTLTRASSAPDYPHWVCCPPTPHSHPWSRAPGLSTVLSSRARGRRPPNLPSTLPRPALSLPCGAGAEAGRRWAPLPWTWTTPALFLPSPRRDGWLEGWAVRAEIGVTTGKITISIQGH